VHYVFDLNKQFNNALALFQLIKNDPKISSRHRMGGIDFEANDKFPDQAADLLAYQTYQLSKSESRGRGLS
jgi:hypothetical protein